MRKMTLDERCKRSAEIILKSLTTEIEELGMPLVTVNYHEGAVAMIATALAEIVTKVTPN